MSMNTDIPAIQLDTSIIPEIIRDEIDDYIKNNSNAILSTFRKINLRDRTKSLFYYNNSFNSLIDVKNIEYEVKINAHSINKVSIQFVYAVGNDLYVNSDVYEISLYDLLVSLFNYDTNGTKHGKTKLDIIKDLSEKQLRELCKKNNYCVPFSFIEQGGIILDYSKNYIGDIHDVKLLLTDTIIKCSSKDEYDASNHCIHCADSLEVLFKVFLKKTMQTNKDNAFTNLSIVYKIKEDLYCLINGEMIEPTQCGDMRLASSLGNVKFLNATALCETVNDNITDLIESSSKKIVNIENNVCLRNTLKEIYIEKEVEQYRAAKIDDYINDLF